MLEQTMKIIRKNKEPEAKKYKNLRKDINKEF